MVKTIDKDAIQRTMSKRNWELLPFNADGTKGQRHLSLIDNVTIPDEIDNQMAMFIEQKKTLSEKITEVQTNKVIEAPITDEITGQVEPIIEEKKEDVIVEKKPVVKRKRK